LSESKTNFTTSEGSEYTISFSQFNSDVHDLDIEIYDLVLKQKKNCGDHNYEALMYLSKLVLEFLSNNECIVYFYSDNAPIKKSKRNMHLSNQEFRSKMFSALFEKLKFKSRLKEKPFNYIIRTTEIKDSEVGNHYISLLSNTEQGEELEELTASILSMNDK